jgi:tRNA-uridine 2-sulfurtransferase
MVSRIVVAMSGGVDSSVAAALLVEQGHEVIGLSMQLYDQRGGVPFGSCCTLDDLHDARRVAATLGIPHYLVNFERQFDEHVVSNFVREYAAGRTPIPCVHCNGDLKFATLVERARGLDAEWVATGHYARVDRDEATGRYRLRRGVDEEKDQSYFLFTLDQAQLARARFPIGGWRKTAVRAYARDRGLPVAEKPDSHEICFVPAGGHAEFVAERAAPAAGHVTDLTGRVVGRHDGVHRFTVGQRKGLGLSAGVPLYVVELKAETNTVVVGPRAALAKGALTASGVNWIDAEPEGGLSVTARIRHRHRDATARVTPLPGGRAALEFDEPQAAVAPGQAVVFYRGDTVAGGGWID